MHTYRLIGSFLLIFFLTYTLSLFGLWETHAQSSCNKTQPNTLSCFEVWRRAFLGEISAVEGDFDGDSRATLADFETWRRSFTTQISSTPAPTITPTGNPSQACETRGVWLNPSAFTIVAKRSETIANIKLGNLNTVFLASYTLGGNFGWADKTSFDAFLADAKTAGISPSIHVWLSSMDRTGNRGLLDYRNVSEQTAHQRWCSDWLAAYPALDGIQLDNVRYQNVGMDDSRRKGIADTMRACYQGMNTTGGRHRYLTSFVDNIDPVPTNAGNTGGWFSTWLNQNPNNLLRFNAVQYYPSNLKVDPIAWIKGGYFDALMPGDYTSSIELWQRRTPIWKSLLGADFDKVVFGVAWMDVKPDNVWYPDGQHFSGGGANAASVVSQIRYAQSQGMKGFSIFQFGRPPAGVSDSTLANALSQGTSAPFAQQKPSCISSL